MRANDSGRAQLCDRVRYWSQRLKVEARIIRVQRMTRKWGSCSTKGIITLAEDLIEQEPGFQDFVIAHEFSISASRPWPPLHGADDGSPAGMA